MVVHPRAVPPQPTLEDGTGNCADRQSEIDRLQAEIKALTDVEQLLQNIGVGGVPASACFGEALLRSELIDELYGVGNHTAAGWQATIRSSLRRRRAAGRPRTC